MKGLILVAVLLATTFVVVGESPQPNRLARLKELMRTGIDTRSHGQTPVDDGAAELAVVRAAIASPSRDHLIAMEQALHTRGLDGVCSGLSEQEINRMLLLSIWFRTTPIILLDDMQQDLQAIKKRLGLHESYGIPWSE